MNEPHLKGYLCQNPINPARVIEGEVVIVSPDDSLLHSLNPVATFIWERADGTRTIDAIVDDLCRAFEVDRERASRDAAAFVQACLEKRVLLLSANPVEPNDQG